MTIRTCIAEDFPLIREALRAQLQLDPRIVVVEAAASAAEMIRSVRAQRPEVAVIDLHLPDCRGTELIEALRREHPELRILVLTASDHAGRAHAALTTGANGYVLKSQPIEQLVEAVVAVAAGGTVVAPKLTAQLLAPTSDESPDEHASYRPDTTDLRMLKLLVDGATDERIARELFVSTRTVQNHLSRIRRRVGARRRAELARWAVEHTYV